MMTIIRWLYLICTVFSARQHICLMRYMLSPVCPSVRMSVCQSVTRVDQSKMVEVRIVQFSQYRYRGPITRFLRDKLHPKILTGTPTGSVNQGRGGGTSYFLPLFLSISKTLRDKCIVSINHK